MSRLKPGDIVTMNDAGVEHMGTFPHVAGCDGKPNDLSPFMLIDIHFDKVT